MGEYFNWVNADRREFLCPNDFDLGNKRSESMHRGNALLKALRDLLGKEWKGDRILFLGDEKSIPADTDNPTLKLLYEQTKAFGSPGNVSDLVDETYKNMSGLFAAAETDVRLEIDMFLDGGAEGRNEYGIDPKDPYAKLFLRAGKEFRYTINHSKKVYYALGETRIRYQDGSASDTIDPLPLLMGYGRATDTGSWGGDVVGGSDEIPAGYVFQKDIWLDW